ncbi:MAG: hypothetical protein AB7K04_08200, partial [Pseudorhodoplanes sp.]
LAQGVGTFSNSKSSVGAVGVKPPPRTTPMIAGSEMLARRHMGFNGKPCLTVQGYSRPQTVNPNIFEHVILANNSCSQLIKLQVCYYKNINRCLPMAVSGGQKQELVLGIYPALRDFRYEFRELF